MKFNINNFQQNRNTFLHKSRRNIHKVSSPMTFTRKEQIQITRLRIAYSNIAHSHLIRKQYPEPCEYCRTSNAVEYLHCATPNSKIQRKISNDVQSLLTNRIRRKNLRRNLRRRNKKFLKRDTSFVSPIEVQKYKIALIG